MTANTIGSIVIAALCGAVASWIYYVQNRYIDYLAEEIGEAWLAIAATRQWLRDEFGDYEPHPEPAPTETTVIRTDTDEVHAAIDNGIRGIVEPTTQPTAVVRPVYPTPTDDLEQRIAAIRRQSAERASRRH